MSTGNSIAIASATALATDLATTTYAKSIVSGSSIRHKNVNIYLKHYASPTLLLQLLTFLSPFQMST
jgi:hypothetical protein